MYTIRPHVIVTLDLVHRIAVPSPMGKYAMDMHVYLVVFVPALVLSKETNAVDSVRVEATSMRTMASVCVMIVFITLRPIVVR